MPTPVRRRSQGLTLVEVVLVVALIGILAATVMSTLGGSFDKHQLEAEAKRLASVVELVRREAVLRNEALAVAIDPLGYSVVRPVPTGRWPLVGQPPLGRHDVADGIQIYVPQRGERRVDTVLVWESGELTPFDIRMTGTEEETWYVASDGLARAQASIRPPVDRRPKSVILSF